MGAYERLRYDAARPSVAASKAFSFAAKPFRQPLWKSAFDKVFAAGALIFFAPILLSIAAAIYLKEGRQVLYRSRRVGEGGQPFDCLKFRTMVLDAEARLAAHLRDNPDAREEWRTYRKLDNDPRVTCFGLFLRKSSLDELPQFWNVLRGEMSIVGPRPIMSDEALNYGTDFKYYLAARPGITGLWQVSGRSGTSYDRRVQLDKTYATHRNLGLDLKIILKTVKVVLTRDGAV